MTQAADRMTALGQMLWLCAQTPNFSKMSLAANIGSLQHSLDTGQFRIYRAADGAPLACVGWVWLHQAHEPEMMAASSPEQLVVKPEWCGGDRLWFVNFVAPFGHARAVTADLRKNVFPTVDCARAIRIDKEGQLKHLALFRRAPRAAAERPLQTVSSKPGTGVAIRTAPDIGSEF